MSIGQVCDSKVTSLPETASIIEAAKIMEKDNAGYVVITDGNNKQPVGILTDRDIVVGALAKEKNINSLKTKDLMSKDLLLIKANDSIKTTLDSMCEKGVRRAPIVDSDNNLCGIATLDDLVFMLASELKVASDLIHNQVTTTTQH